MITNCPTCNSANIKYEHALSCFTPVVLCVCNDCGACIEKVPFEKVTDEMLEKCLE